MKIDSAVFDDDDGDGDGDSDGDGDEMVMVIVVMGMGMEMVWHYQEAQHCQKPLSETDDMLHGTLVVLAQTSTEPRA